MARVLTLAAIALGWLSLAYAGGSVQIRPPDISDSEHVVEVVGLDDAQLGRLRDGDLSLEQWQSLFAVYVRDGGAGALAMLGSYEVVAGAIRFVPRFPFVLGLEYRVVVDEAALLNTGRHEVGPLEEFFLLPRPDVAPSTSVVGVYPTAEMLPANLLRFYIYFSAPMHDRGAFQRVRLFDAEGAEVAEAFVETPELWDRQRVRLTMICHPGRIKRGLDMHEAMGPPLVEGDTYRLVVERTVTDAAGQPLVSDYEKHFMVTAADRQSPDPMSWEVQVPEAGTTMPLRLSFLEPLDHALLQRLVMIEDVKGERVPGQIEVDPGETGLSYHPEAAWTSVEYTVVIHPDLEDLAGNRIDRLFDEPGSTSRDTTLMIRLPFRAREETGR